MDVFNSMMTFGMNFAGVIFEVLCGTAMIFIVYWTIWFMISMIWQIFHESSYIWFVSKMKSLRKKLLKKLGVD